MKDLLIPAKSIRREIRLLALCILLALLINAAAIIAYHTQWIELLTTWHITLAIACVLYVLSALLRLGWAGLHRLWARPGR